MPRRQPRHVKTPSARLKAACKGTIVAKWTRHTEWKPTEARDIELGPDEFPFARATSFTPREEVVTGRARYMFVPVKRDTAVFVPDGAMIGVLVPSGDQTLLVLVPMEAVEVSCLSEAVATFKPTAWPVKETDERGTHGLFRCIAELLAVIDELESTLAMDAMTEAMRLLGKLGQKCAGYQRAAPTLHLEVLALYLRAEERIHAVDVEEAHGANAPEMSEATEPDWLSLEGLDWTHPSMDIKSGRGTESLRV